IERQERLQKKFSGERVFKPSEVAVTSLDEQFLHGVLQAIEQNLDEESFSVVELAQAASMSRSQLHRKLKALTGKSPNELIREMRLQRARELLEKGAGNASEVAFRVGFNSLAYFSKCFSDFFGLLPSEVRQKRSP
ncbi:MAG: helix-turn-helix transcriptional regulator, partial [Saprospiraceae bacterium]|nr:helix-turn-helix transcriptional regulator [Saprospiraceae bacterium]